jgi:transcriptional regulator with XRE-family HTH domain
VRAGDFHSALQRAGMTERDLADLLGMTQQSIDRMIHGRSPASPRFVRDVGLVLGERLGEDADFVRSVLFTGSVVAEPKRSVLTARISMEEAN